MSYSSINFMIFLLVTLGVFYLVPKKIQWIVLLCGSIFFYCFSNYTLGIYLLITVITTWAGALTINKLNSGLSITERSKKSVFVYIIVVVANIAIISTFKFSDLIIPIGLSFYTFQMIGYLTDVFRKACEPQKNFAKYLLFASFFPQILSGPIGRFENLSPQFFVPKKYNADTFSMGAQRIIWGLFKKMVIADRLSIIVNQVFDNPTDYKGYHVAVVSMLFLIQLYADFSGLIDIASGSAQMFQVELAVNFNTPLFAVSISDFWNRWHISLSTWFKDYLFYPLIKSKLFLVLKDFFQRIFGKKKGKNITTYIGMMILWLTIGLWHGVQGHYIIGAGLIFGFYIITGKILAPVFEILTKSLRLKRSNLAYRFFEILRTFMLLSLAMLFWKSESISVALIMIKRLITEFNVGKILKVDLVTGDFLVLIIGLIILFIVDVIHYKNIRIREKLIRKTIFIKWPVYIFAVMTILLFGMYGSGYNPSDFIYFKF